MIIKNIVIKNENKNITIEVSDATFNTNKIEQNISRVFSIAIKELVKDKNFERLVK